MDKTKIIFKENMMKKLFCLITFLTLGFSVALMGVSSPAYATTPTISDVSGTIATGQTITISGTTMVDEDKTNWSTGNSVNFKTGTAYGFEGSDPIADGYNRSGTNITHDTSIKLSGSKSIKGECSGSGHAIPCNAYIYDPSVSGNTVLYIRGYQRWHLNSSGYPSDNMKMWWIGGGSGGELYFFQPYMPGGTPGRPSTFYGLWGEIPTVDQKAIPSGMLEDDRWYCFEMQINRQGTTPYTTKSWIDNTLLHDQVSTHGGAWVGGWVSFLSENFSSTQTTNFTVWADNMVLSNSRIYCSSIIEIGNSSDYATATKKYQAPVTLSDGSIQIKVDLTGLGSGPYYLWVTNNRQEQSAVYALSGSGGDTTPPSVSITAPTSGSTVSGTTTVSADASDNIGVVGSQFKLDGANLNSEDTNSPYSISWNTTTASNGSHTLTATARDAAGNETTSSAVSITVDNADTTPPAAPTGLTLT